MRPPTGLSGRLCLEVARKIDGVSYAACQALVFGHIDSQLLQSATDKKRDFDRIGLKPDYSQMSGRFGAVAMTAAGRPPPFSIRRRSAKNGSTTKSLRAAVRRCIDPTP